MTEPIVDEQANSGVASEPSPVEPRSLWRDGNFLTMWTGQALSQFGGQFAELAIPVVAVLLLGAGEFEVGVLNAATMAAFLVIGLPAGAWVDRMRKRRVMIAADLVRAVALAFIPLLWWLGVLEVWHLILVALVLSVATVFFDVAYQSILPSLVPARSIAEANGKLESTTQIAGIAGPAAAGWFVGFLAAPLVVVGTVVTYLVSFVALLFVRDREQLPERHERQPLAHEIGEGLRFVFGHRQLRLIVATTGSFNFFSTIMTTLLPLFLLRDLGFSPAELGLVFSISAVGGFVGAIATPHLVRWIGESRLIPVSGIAGSVVAFGLPIAALVPSIAFPLVIAQGFATMFTVVVYNITQVTFRQRVTPPRLLGRMNASIRFVVWGVMPIAALLAGLIGEALGVPAAIWISAVGTLIAAVPVLPLLRSRELPGV